MDSPLNCSNNSEEIHIPVQFPNQLKESTVPLLLNPAYARQRSCIYDELRNFRLSLKWCALDHSSIFGKVVSYMIFVVLTIAVPVISLVLVQAPNDTTLVFNRVAQLPESGLAVISYFTLACFFQQYGLRNLLFLDGLHHDSVFVRHGYTRELDKSFRHLIYILLPSFSIELVHKIIFFCTITVKEVPYLTLQAPFNSIALFVAVLVSWVYRTGVFLLLCVMFRLTCQLQILRFEEFRKLFEECGSDSAVIFREHMRIKAQLLVTSHRYRIFIIWCLVTITVSQFGALLMVLASKSVKSFFNSGDLVVCSAVELCGFFMCLMGAARITHRAQRVVSIATRWHMLMTCGSSSSYYSGKDVTTLPVVDQSLASNEDTCISHHSQQDSASASASAFKTRQALVMYLQHNNGGITLFGFALDRGLLHTLFAFHFSLVLWILSKVVVLS